MKKPVPEHHPLGHLGDRTFEGIDPAYGRPSELPVPSRSSGVDFVGGLGPALVRPGNALRDDSANIGGQRRVYQVAGAVDPRRRVRRAVAAGEVGELVHEDVRARRPDGVGDVVGIERVRGAGAAPIACSVGMAAVERVIAVTRCP